MVKVIIQKDH